MAQSTILVVLGKQIIEWLFTLQCFTGPPVDLGVQTVDKLRLTIHFSKSLICPRAHRVLQTPLNIFLSTTVVQDGIADLFGKSPTGHLTHQPTYFNHNPNFILHNHYLLFKIKTQTNRTSGCFLRGSLVNFKAQLKIPLKLYSWDMQ